MTIRRCLGHETLFDQKLVCLDQILKPLKHAESHNLLKYWFTLWHFVMDDPVFDAKIDQTS